MGPDTQPDLLKIRDLDVSFTLPKGTAQALRGINFTIEDPRAAYSISEKYIEGLADSDSDIQMQILTESISHYQTDPMGYSDPTAWHNMQDILLRMELLSKPIAIESAYTNQYLPSE